MSCLEQFGSLQPLKPVVMDSEYFNDEQISDWTEEGFYSSEDDYHDITNAGIWYLYSTENGKVTQDWYTSAVKYTEELQQDARIDCAQSAQNEEEIMGYDLYTKEDIVHLNRYFEGLELHKKLQEKAYFKEFEHATNLLKEAEDSTLRHDLPVHRKPSAYPDLTGRSLCSPTDSANVDRRLLIDKTKDKLMRRSAEDTTCVSNPEDDRVQVVKEGGLSMLQFSVRVEFVESDDSVICSIPAVRGAVESFLASKFPAPCVGCRLAKCGSLDHGQALRAIDLTEVRPHQLVLVASSRGQLFRALVQVIRDSGTRVSGIGVGFVDKPGGTFTSQLFECPTDVAAVPYALLRLKVGKQAKSHRDTVVKGSVVNLKELQKGEIRTVLCHAIEGTTAFGVFAEPIEQNKLN